MKGEHLMKTITKSKSMRRSRAFLLSVLCAGVIATFIGGCAEGPYVTAYDGGYYYPTAYYTPAYDYYGYPYSTIYGPTYSRTVVRSGVRYYDSYGPRYYTSYGYYLRHALDDASAPSASGGCADASKRVIKGTQDFPRAVATALRRNQGTALANQPLAKV